MHGCVHENSVLQSKNLKGEHMKRLILSLVASLGAVAVFFGLVYSFPKAFASNQICFCHNVNHNPHTICTSNQAVINGHTSHVRNGEDTLGICSVARPTPTATPRPSASPWVSPSPLASSEPSATPSATPQESVCRENCGVVPTFPHDEQVHTNQCVGDAPKEPLMLGFKRVNPTTVAFSWWPVDGVDHYSMIYGYSEDNLSYGIPYLAKEATSVDVSNLEANKTVFARLMAENANYCTSWSNIIDP